MNTNFAKKLFASAIALSLTCTGLVAQADKIIEATNVDSAVLLDFYCPTNDDSEFPLSININVEENSIRYIDLDEPIYGFDSILDEELLRYGLIFSLKDEYKDFDTYKISIFDSNYTDTISSVCQSKNCVTSVSDLSIGTNYKITIELECDYLTAYYAGQFVVQAELDSTLVVDMFYQISDIEGDATNYATTLYENEQNNDYFSNPDLLYHNKALQGNIDSTDIDYFQYSSANKVSEDDPDEDDRTGVANLQFTITLSEVAKIQLDFFNSNGMLIGEFVLNGNSKTLYCKLNNVEISTTYKIKLTTSSNSTLSYSIKPSYNFSLAWFSQYISKDSNGGIYWNTNKVDQLTYNGEPVFIENGNVNSSHFGTACGVVSSAMIMRNLGATMNGYDFRINFEGELQADPFTTLLASCGLDGTELNSNSTVFPKPAHNDWPSSLYRYNVASAFGKNVCDITKTESALRNAVEDYGYVLIYFNNSHFMLITGFKEGDTFADRILVCDPAARSYSKGIGENGVGLPLSETTSGYSTRTISDITYARCYTSN